MDLKVIMDLTETWGILLIPLVIAVTSLVKGFLPENQISRFSPVISAVAGIAGGILTIGITRQGILTGLIIGLTASGLFSGAKSIVNAPPKTPST